MYNPIYNHLYLINGHNCINEFSFWCETSSIHGTAWRYTYPSEKYESQLGWLFPTYGKIKNAPNNQPG